MDYLNLKLSMTLLGLSAADFTQLLHLRFRNIRDIKFYNLLQWMAEMLRCKQFCN